MCSLNRASYGLDSGVHFSYYISYATASFEYAKAFAGVLTISIIGFILDRLLIFLRNRIIFWERISGAYA
ncbi:MAG: hypothetical protein EXR27_14020 [Betaproteobacteria bacterium]|nr:hypothetical protein [Betaproteobacteria bacterium]